MITKTGASLAAKALALGSVPVVGTLGTIYADKNLLNRDKETTARNNLSQAVGGLAGMSAGGMLGTAGGAIYGLANRNKMISHLAKAAPGGVVGRTLAGAALRHMPGIAGKATLAAGAGAGLAGGIAAGGLLGAGTGRIMAERNSRY